MGRRKRKTLLRGNSAIKEASFETMLASIFLSRHLVFSPEESESLAASMMADMQDSKLPKEQAFITAFEDYFSISREDANELVKPLFNTPGCKDDDENVDSTEEEAAEELTREGEGSDDDGEYVGEGECELCERKIRLTRHHLIPKVTWPRILPRLANALDAAAKNDTHRAALILGPGMAHFTQDLARLDNKADLKGLLQRTCDICRPCHNAIHQTYGNITLATHFNTTELLLNDATIYNFCRWASKQKTGKYKAM